MQASIADILDHPDSFADQIVNVDGILLITNYDRSVSRFQQVWLVKQDEPENRAIRAEAIQQRLHLVARAIALESRDTSPGFQTYRVHDAVRACVRVLPRPLSASRTRRRDLDRRRLSQGVHALCWRERRSLGSGNARTHNDPRPARDSSLYRAFSRPPLPYLRHAGHPLIAAGSISCCPAISPYAADFRRTVERLGSGDIEVEWLADIEYPQSESEPIEFDRLPETIRIDPEYAIRDQLSVLPGITQTIVKPAIVVGALAARDHDEHFATLTEIENVYLQNICYTDEGKVLESVIKLKNFEAHAMEI